MSATLPAPAPDDYDEDAAVYASLTGATVDVDAPTARVLGDWYERMQAASNGPVPALPESVVRFVAKGSETPPLHRWRIVDGTVLERWQAIEGKPIRTTDRATMALLAGQDRVIGWNVVRLPMPQRSKVARIEIREGRAVCLDGFGRPVEPKPMTGPELREHVLSLQLAPEDDVTYNGFYPTLPGNDIAHYDERAFDAGHRGVGEFRSDMAEHQGGAPIRKRNPDWQDPAEDGFLRGGREIRGGRAEHRAATKDMIHVDAGFQKHHDRLVADRAAEKKAADRLKIERTLRAGPEVPNDV